MKILNKNPIVAVLAVLVVLIILGKPVTSRAAAIAPALGTTANFSVLGGSTITNTGSTVISKDFGLSPGTSATGFTFSVIPGPGIVNGTTHIADGAAIQAQTDATTAYTGLSQACDFGPFGPTDLAGATLVPGVYCYSSSVQISSGGVLTLDAQSDPNAVWVFKAVSTLTTISGASVVFVGGVGQACNVFWQVGSSATLGTTTAFVGTIIAADDITLATGATLNGRVFARGVSADGAVTLDANTISGPTCTAPTTTLTVTKTVNNNHGGTKGVSDFPLFIDGKSVASGVASTTSAGLHTVSETSDPGYTSVIGGDCAADGTITLVAGTAKACTITNNDIAPILHLRKVVVGGTATTTDFTLTAAGTGANILTGTSPVDSTGTLKADTFALSETNPGGYTASSWSCIKNGSAPVTGATVALGLADTATCSITNTDPAATETITVVKLVIGGTKGVADFPLSVNATAVNSGDTNSFPAPAAYTVAETSNSNYTATFSGDCPSGIVNLVLGAPKICTITNTYTAPASGGGNRGMYTPPVPPLIDVVKVPNPLALPGGPGLVTYTYTLRNTGTVAVSNITMVGDTCSHILLVSGDLNNNAKLDVNETWVYTCSATLSATHTNIVTATGWANGISAVDIASATVVVGVPVVPPLIHMTKIPSPLTLSVSGGIITYTETITNPGAVPLSNVLLTDDKCGPVKYISGDTNNDFKLDPTETWIYTCRANLTQTTTNTATASGDANGLVARDFAIATVVVADAIPKLPNTGIPPAREVSPLAIAILAGILVAMSLLYALLKNKHNKPILITTNNLFNK